MTKHLSLRIPKTNRELRFTSELGILFVIFALSAAAFVNIADEVLDRDTYELDVAILRTIHSWSSPFLDRVMPVLTDIGGLIGATLLAVSATAFVWLAGKKRKALVIAISSIGALLINLFLKALFGRPRPNEWTRLVEETSYSFPSGHAMASAALGFALIVIAWRTRWRWAVVGICAAYILMIGFTRLYLGVHYPTDVVAGWFVSAGWVAVVVIMLYGRLGKHNDLTE